MRFYIVTILLLLLAVSCQQSTDNTLLRLVPGSRSGIEFSNDLRETYGENMLLFSNFYTGGGVGIIDINNDNLPDIIFGGNQVSSRLYLNKGGLKFKDITESAGIVTDRWVTGISVVDINSDGYDDFYLSVSGLSNISKTNNQLFINNGDNTFTDQAAAYGLDEKEQTTHTSFLDYDQDGDLDAFMAINPSDFSLFYMGQIKKRKLNGEARSTDKLFENLGNGTFKDVSKQAGIGSEGYSLGVNTGDFNSDGLPDIFVSNDFIFNDILYINNGDGSFTNELNSNVNVSSYASMGNDAADINNDGNIDFITLDMKPEDSYREKLLVSASSYNTYKRTLSLGYHPQFTRNMLQINNGDGTFSEIGQLAGISKTDWSWSSLFIDLDNDGFKDLFISNGFRRELGNLDYINYNEFSPFTNPGSDLQSQIDGINNAPGIAIPNYVYKNNGDLTFTNKVEEWGLELPTYSNGAASVDLDLDGDLDLVVNNIDMEASVYENLSNKKFNNHYIDVQLVEYQGNRTPLGSKIFVYTNGKQQMIEVNPYRGYLSSIERKAHFGLGDNISSVDSVKVYWPDGRLSMLTAVGIDTIINVAYASSSTLQNSTLHKESSDQLFTDITSSAKLNFRHQENNQVDFHKQFLLPHQHSKLGPGIAVGDVNGDGYDDCYIGGAHGQSGQLFIQQADGTFTKKWSAGSDYEDMGALFFDFDRDGDNDLYVASGGTHAYDIPENFEDRLYINDGRGNFEMSTGVIPKNGRSSSSVSASDFDKDGDLDLFIGGRIKPREYPSAPTSVILKNEGGRFIEVTEQVAPGLKNIGMVTQGLWTDYDNDNDVDLVVVGEWMPITLFENNNGQLTDKTSQLGLAQQTGWWNSITASDQNSDGRLDYILGNLGANNEYDISGENPLVLYSKDFDNNGSIDPILTKRYIDGEYPIASRDRFLSQLTYLKSNYTSYESYAVTKTKELFTEEDWQDVTIHEAATFDNSILMNFGKDSLQRLSLPKELQIAPIFGSVSVDITQNGTEEAIISGNFYSNNASNGPIASSTGALLRRTESDYSVTRGHDNGLNYRGDRKALATIELANGHLAIVSTVNDNDVSLHKIESQFATQRYEEDEFKAIITLQDGREILRESYYGSGYLSHNSRLLILPQDWETVSFYKFTGEQRLVSR